MDDQNAVSRQEQLKFFLYFSLTAITGGIAAKILWQIPGSGTQFSPVRIGLLAFLCCCSLAALVLALITFQQKQFILIKNQLTPKVRRALPFLLRVSCLITVPFLLIPPERLKSAAAIAERLRPILGWIAWSSASGLVLLGSLDAERGGLDVQTQKKLLSGKPFIVFFSLFCAASLFIAASGWGISSAGEVWYENAIPLLPQQIILALLSGGLCFRLMLKSGRQIFAAKTFWFFVIWALAACCWLAVPMRRHFFAPGPYPPNDQFYPYSDALGNDAAAQSALAGLGFNFDRIVLKPVVTFLIYLCALLSGNEMNLTLAIQCALFGVLPALLFLFVAEDSSLLSGWIAAGLMIMHEINALNSDTVLTVHSKLEMSEFLAEILFLLSVRAVFKFTQNHEKSAYSAAAAGGILALLIFTRFNFAAMLPAVILFGLIALWQNKKRWAVNTIIFLLSFILAVSPWIYRSCQLTGKIAPEIFDTFRVVIMDQRLRSIPEPSAKTNKPTDEAALPEPDVQFPGIPTQPALPVSQPVIESGRQPALRLSPIFDTIANHTLHNLTALMFLLPHQTSWNSLSATYSSENSLWRSSWDGSLTIPQLLTLFLNGVLLCFGLASLWRKYRWRGLTVPYLVAVYAASLGISRTSGGRYLVPMNWSVVYLASIGLGQLFDRERLKFSQPRTSKRPDRKIRLVWLFLIPIAFAGVYFTMIMIEKISVPKITAKTSEQQLAHMAAFTDEEETVSTAMAAVREGKVHILSGWGLYPRFYYFNQGESGMDAAFLPQPYSRLVFRLLQSEGYADVVLPIETIPEPVHQAADYQVIGCFNQEKGIFDALAIFIETRSGEKILYNRQPAREYSCPIAEPVCPATNTCY